MWDETNPPDENELGSIMRQISAQLRLSLGNIHMAMGYLAPPDARDQNNEMDHYAAILSKSYYSLVRLANNLGDTVDSDKPMQVERANVDMVQLCQDVAAKVETPAKLLGLTLTFRCKCKGNICVIAVDEKQIRRVLLNLLSNAFKFTPPGGEVILALSADAQWVKLDVIDNGQGIPSEILSTIYDRYRHADRMDPPPHGLGLGLPICQRIVEAHGGHLAVMNVASTHGTTASIMLRHQRIENTGLKSPMIFDLSGGFNPVLVELSDALPSQAFEQKYVD